MNSLEIVMPGMVLALSFALKLFIDRTATLPDAISSVLELPVDIAFLSMTLIVGYTLSPGSDAKIGLAWFSFYLLGTIFVVAIWRRSIAFFINESHLYSLGLGAMNYIISLVGIFQSVAFLTGGSNGFGQLL
jgi:hypothetical protein